MSRLLVKGEWYRRLASTAVSEDEYHRLLAEHAPTLFPEYSLVDFKIDIESEHGIRRPDFALVEKDYRKWWVVEVEMAHHSLFGHVVPQIRVFASGTYGKAHALWLAAKSSLARGRLEEMLKGAAPGVLVIVNEPVPEWDATVRSYDARLSLVEIYRSSLNDHVLRANGEYPEPSAGVLTVCRFEPLMPQMMRVESPTALPVADGHPLLIEFQGSVTEWRRKDAENKVWLLPGQGRNPLPAAHKTFYLTKRQDGSLVFTGSAGGTHG